MTLDKSYELLKYLNRSHNIFSRYGLGGVAFLGALVLSKSWTLALLMRKDFVADNFFYAFRRAAWFFRKSLYTPKSIDDPFFDFSHGANDKERAALQEFIKNRKKGDWLSDLLYVQAASIHEGLFTGVTPSVTNHCINDFYNCADSVLQKISPSFNNDMVASKEMTREGDFSKEDARIAFVDFANLLPLSDWKWFVVSGTFLGLHRDDGFIAHDYDIDVGLMCSDVELKSLLGVLNADQCFSIKKVDDHINITRELSGFDFKVERFTSLIKLVHKNGLSIDIFIHYIDNDKCWHGSIIHKWENTKFDLVERTLEGVTVLAPKNASLYLAENYGDWETPIKDFDCTTGTPNLVVSKNFLAIALFIKKLAYFSREDEKSYLSLLRALSNGGVLNNANDEWLVNRSFI